MPALLIFVPGAVPKPAAHTALLCEIVEGHPGCRVQTWDRPITVLSRIPLGLRAANLSGQIKNWLLQLDDEGHEIDEILLVGHSVGGLTARDAYLIDLEGAADWAPLVKRIALLATPNRGVDRPRLPFKYQLPMLLFGWLFTDRVVWKQTLRGSAYVTNLRVRWIRRFNQPGFLPPYIVQLRAEDDPIVLPQDSRDVWQFANAGEEVVSGSTHQNIASVDGPDGVVAQRVQILRRALFGSPIVNDPPAVSPKEAVALLLHGIRSSSTGWPELVAAQLGEAGGQEIECVRPSYGYLPALDFALTPLRRSRKRWIRDAYSDSFARYPQAAFHFVGHSNGTYLFRLLLHEVGGARFESAYLGGCVLPRSMSWDRHLDAEKTPRSSASCTSRPPRTGRWHGSAASCGASACATWVRPVPTTSTRTTRISPSRTVSLATMGPHSQVTLPTASRGGSWTAKWSSRSRPNSLPAPAARGDLSRGSLRMSCWRPLRQPSSSQRSASRRCCPSGRSWPAWFS